RRSVTFATIQEPLRPRVRQVRERTKSRAVRSKRSETIWIPRKHRNRLYFGGCPHLSGEGVSARRQEQSGRIGPRGIWGSLWETSENPPALLRSRSSGALCGGPAGIGETTKEGSGRGLACLIHAVAVARV